MRQLRFFVVTFGLLVSFCQAFGAEMCEGLFNPKDWDMSEQIQKNRFITNRDLTEYMHQLHPHFVGALRKLGPENHWIDLGAGKAIAQTQYLKTFDHIQKAPFATAVAFKIDRWLPLPSFKGKLQVREGAFEAQDTSTWRKADVITDVMGVLSYTRDLSTSLQKVVDLLNVNGELYIEFAPWVTSVQDAGTQHKFLGFLERIDGLQVTGNFGIVKVVKKREHIQIPRMELVLYREDYPPYRAFKVIDPAP